MCTVLLHLFINTFSVLIKGVPPHPTLLGGVSYELDVLYLLVLKHWLLGLAHGSPALFTARCCYIAVCFGDVC